MKKLILALLAVFVLCFAACGTPENNPIGDEPELPGNGDEPQTPLIEDTVELQLYQVAWFGNLYQDNNTNFYIQMVEDAETGNGVHVVLDIIAQGETFNPTGTYTPGESGAWSIVPGNDDGSGSYVAKLVNGSIPNRPDFIEDEATLTIECNGDYYDIMLVFDNKAYHACGTIELANGAFPLEPMTPSDFSINPTRATGTYFGDTGYGSDEYNITLTGDYYAQLEIYAPNGSASNALPEGTYNVANTFAPNTMYPGFFYDGNIAPSLVYNSSDGQHVTDAWYIASGFVTIEKKSYNYTISGTVVSALGSVINISYSGYIQVRQGSARQPVIAAKSLKQTK